MSDKLIPHESLEFVAGGESIDFDFEGDELVINTEGDSGDPYVPAGTVHYLKKDEAIKLYNFIGEWLEEPSIKDIKTLKIDEGDKIVLTVKDRLSDFGTCQLKEILIKEFPDNKIIILHAGLDLATQKESK